MGSNMEELDEIASRSIYDKGLNAQMIKYSSSLVSKFLKKDMNILELGPAEGIMTETLIEYSKTLTLVEGSSYFCEQLKEKYPEAIVINSLFEELSLSSKYDFIVLGHVLEHVDDPVLILKKIKDYLNPGGRIISIVPNSHSIHRQAAVIMGLLHKEDSMSEKDIYHGHRRVYNMSVLKNHFLLAGLNIEKSGGFWLKPLSDRQIEESWTQEMIDAFFKLGEEYPSISAEIYIVASLEGEGK